MVQLKVDGIEITAWNNAYLWCGPAEYSENEGQALCCEWAMVPNQLRGALAELRTKCCGIVNAFMENNKAALETLKSIKAEEWTAEREAYEVRMKTPSAQA